MFTALQSPIHYMNKQMGIKSELAAPEFSNNNAQQSRNALKKTHSHPAKSSSQIPLPPSAGGKQSKGKAAGRNSSPANPSNDASSAQSGGKHARTKSIPGAIHNSTGSTNKEQTLASKAGVGAPDKSSPKPKRGGLFEGFKNTLRPKKHSSSDAASKSSSHLGSSSSSTDKGGSLQVSSSHPLVAKSSSHIPQSAFATTTSSSYANEASRDPQQQQHVTSPSVISSSDVYQRRKTSHNNADDVS